MNRLNLLLFLSLMFLISCQSESPPEKVDEPVPIPEELSFETIDKGITGTWVANVSLDQPISGTTMDFEPGEGILILDASNAKNEGFQSTFSHGDIELDVEFMMTRGANAVIEFQGVHGLNLLDSWNKSELDKNTLGSLEEIAPKLNTSLAPGLWQHLRVLYHAPDEANPKEAIFQEVYINGMLVQEGIKMEGDQAVLEKAPLFIKVSNGTIAFRNISYKLYGDNLPTLDSLEYKFYKLESKSTAEDFIPDFSSMEAESSGQTDSLTKNVTEDKKDFGLVFDGKFNAPAAGDYLFEVRVQGGAILMIDGKEVVNHDGETNYEEGSAFGSVALTQGAHDFTYLYRKEHMQWRQGLGLFVEGPGIEKMALHSEGSVRPPRKHKAYELAAEAGGTLHRSYLMHKGKKLTHAISIGNKNGLHYSYDLDNASLLQMWGGKFMDVRQMWVGRGAEQLAVPMGASIVHAANPNIAILSSKNASWPNVLDEKGSITYKGYDINPSGEPTFRYKVGEADFTDHITTQPDNRTLLRKLSLRGDANANTYVLLAKGKEIHKASSGVFGVDAYNYYLSLEQASGEPIIRETAAGQELILPISSNSSISYTLTW